MAFTISWFFLKGKWGFGLEPHGVWEAFGSVMMMMLQWTVWGKVNAETQLFMFPILNADLIDICVMELS